MLPCWEMYRVFSEIEIYFLVVSINFYSVSIWFLTACILILKRFSYNFEIPNHVQIISLFYKLPFTSLYHEGRLFEEHLAYEWFIPDSVGLLTN